MVWGSGLKVKDFEPKMRVVYIPPHANGNVLHRDVELGVVSSTNEKNVFVRFDAQVFQHGWEETVSQSCDPDDLLINGNPQVEHACEFTSNEYTTNGGRVVKGVWCKECGRVPEEVTA